jgi:hypothetical protein
MKIVPGRLSRPGDRKWGARPPRGVEDLPGSLRYHVTAREEHTDGKPALRESIDHPETA